MWPASGGNEKKPRKINLLVCTANLGNQEPDLESLSAWIPNDGSIKDVVENPRYPLPEGTNPVPRNFKAMVGEVLRRKSGKPKELEAPKALAEKFDIVVIGMQEATFGVEDSREGRRTTKLLPSQAIKAQKAVLNLTTAKNHLGTAKHRQGKQTDSTPQATRPSLQRLSHTLAKSFNRLPGPTIRWKSSRANSFPEEPSLSSDTKPTSISTTSRANSMPLEVLHEPDADLMRNETSRPKDAPVMHDRKTQNNDTDVLHDLFQAYLPSYEYAASYQRGQMRLLIFYNSNEISLEVISIKAQNTGKGGLANKGGIVCEVLVDRTTRLAFFTAHLEAHEGISKYETRCSSVADIFKGTTSTVTQCRCDASQASHFTFAIGDLNFRTRLPDYEPGSKEHLLAAHAMAKEKDWEGLYKHDELVLAIQNNHCFSGFCTPKCAFPPTFKLERQKGFDYNEKRSPSYTDRILYTTGHRLQDKLKVLAYEPIDNFASSDHKPIRGAFEVELNPRLKWRPTLAKTDTNTDRREYLYLFISSIHVEINKDIFRKKNAESSIPSPFVCFISTPAEAIKKETKKWEKLKRTINVRGGDKKNVNKTDGTKEWPKTRRKRNTFDAFWDGKEGVHFKVRTHTKEGAPIDLSGAMIHVVAYDGKPNGKLVGSFSLNLAHLIIQSREKENLGKTPVESQYTSASFRYGSSRSLYRSNMLNWIVRHEIGSMHSRSWEKEETEKHKKLDRPKFGDEGSSPLGGSESFNDGDRAIVDKTEKRKPLHQNPAGKSNTEGTKHSEINSGNYDNKCDDATGFLTSGPSTELLRRTTQTWLGLRGSHGFGGKMLASNDPKSRERPSLDSMNICSMRVDRPLRKYGLEVGNVRFTMDAWWLSDDAADEKKKDRENELFARSSQLDQNERNTTKQ